MEKKIYDFDNGAVIKLEGVACGMTERCFEVIYRRQVRCVDVVKNALSARIEVYRKLEEDRDSYSKHCPEAELMVLDGINPVAYFGGDLLDSIDEIEKARAIKRQWCRKVQF